MVNATTLEQLQDFYWHSEQEDIDNTEQGTREGNTRRKNESIGNTKRQRLDCYILQLRFILLSSYSPMSGHFAIK
ncbi:hypothetical protein Glove_152g23 [Diversispora epigaea]|uniref:Uncharacterized protein n=1 Tax=Diversispora epigaea TaxID=1348612 RepID=A0A397IZ62_9GLOM|nr:hypothetical protein Glove_152g23 [Diversispora epigaea]